MSKRKMTDDELAAEFILRMTVREAVQREREELEAIAEDESIEVLPDDQADELGVFIRNMERKHTASQKRKHYLNLAAKAAACVIFCAVGIVGAGSIAFQVSAEARGTIATLLMRNFGDYTQIEVLDGYELEKPFGWTSEYYPTWIPEGYHFYKMKLEQHREIIFYQNRDEEEITFQCLKELNGIYNTENRVIETVEVKGIDGFIAQGDDPLTKVLILYAGNEKIVISASVPSTDLLQMAESINGL